jgi:hypothetical protein
VGTDRFWKEGTLGRVYTHHRHDGCYSAPARLTHDSPPDQEEVSVELLGDFYCLGFGDVIETQRYLFRPAAGRTEP